jgi:RNA polymerase sigma-70 factor, ECF subfamily
VRADGNGRRGADDDRHKEQPPMQSQLLDSPRVDVDAFSANWSAHMRYLLDVAYRLLGSLSEAEDVVQEAYARLYRVDTGQIEDARGWLVVAVTRLCLDQLRSARARREVYVGPWLPEPLVGGSGTLDPAAHSERVTLDDSVRMALLVVLERLSPAERVAFVLHDRFQFSFDDVARILERTPAASRQLASRARRHVRDATTPARCAVDPETLRRVTAQFIRASAEGDLDALLDILDPNVIGETDSGGVVNAPRQPVAGNQLVGRLLLTFLKVYRATLRPAPVNGEPGALVLQDGRVFGVISVAVTGERVSYIRSVANPHKLAHLLPLPDAPGAAC